MWNVHEIHIVLGLLIVDKNEEWIFQFKQLKGRNLKNIRASSSTIWISYTFYIISLNGKIWTQQIDLARNVWLHSSVGRASQRYRGGHAFESRWSPHIFQASSFQLLKLENLLRWSLFTFKVINVVNKSQSARASFACDWIKITGANQNAKVLFSSGVLPFATDWIKIKRANHNAKVVF